MGVGCTPTTLRAVNAVGHGVASNPNHQYVVRYLPLAQFSNDRYETTHGVPFLTG